MKKLTLTMQRKITLSKEKFTGIAQRRRPGRIFIPLCAAVKGRLLKKIFLRIVHVTQCVSGVKYGIVLIFFILRCFNLLDFS